MKEDGGPKRETDKIKISFAREIIISKSINQTKIKETYIFGEKSYTGKKTH